MDATITKDSGIHFFSHSAVSVSLHTPTATFRRIWSRTNSKLCGQNWGRHSQSPRNGECSKVCEIKLNQRCKVYFLQKEMYESIQFKTACLFSRSQINFFKMIFLNFFQGIRKKSWSSIIPNSQLIVIPYPNDDPSRYLNNNKIYQYI